MRILYSVCEYYTVYVNIIRCMRILYVVCEYYTYQTTALLPDIFLFWFGTAYELRLEKYGHETVHQRARRSCSSTSVASSYVFRVWHV